MTDSAALGAGIDVFIVFSKKVPGEAKLALAIKDSLEQLGLMPLEYENWTWTAESVEGLHSRELGDVCGDDVDRAALRALFTGSAAVVYVAPLSGEPSDGVQVELAELRACGSPTMLLHWTASWHPLLEPDRVAGLNLVWRTEVTSVGAADIAENTASHVGRMVAGACWLASVLRSLPSDGGISSWLKNLAPDYWMHPLLRFRLTDTDDDAGRAAPDPAANLAASAQHCASECSREELAAFARTWRNGTDLMTEDLANQLGFELGRSMKTLHLSCEALYEAAIGLCPELTTLPWEDELTRAGTLCRLNRNDEATELLTKAVPHLPHEARSQAAQLLAFAVMDSDATSAVDGLTQAIASELDRWQEAVLTYTRGKIRMDQEAWWDAVEDFARVIELGEEPVCLAARLGRARCFARGLDRDADAIADFDSLLEDPLAAPRLSASAWLDRGGLHWKAGRLEQALADWREVIHVADADPLQKFRAHEARGQVLEGLGRWGLAAGEYEAMTAYSSIDAASRAELRQHVVELRGRIEAQPAV